MTPSYVTASESYARRWCLRHHESKQHLSLYVSKSVLDWVSFIRTLSERGKKGIKYQWDWRKEAFIAYPPFKRTHAVVEALTISAISSEITAWASETFVTKAASKTNQRDILTQRSLARTNTQEEGSSNTIFPQKHIETKRAKRGR